MASELLSSSLRAHKKTSKEPLCKLSEGSLPPEFVKKHVFSVGCLRFLTSQLLATLHPKIKPSKPQICLKMPSWTPQEGPRRAQDSPRWAQDGPKKVRRATGKSPKIIPGALLGPSWGTSGLQKTMVFPKYFLIVFNFPAYLASSCSHNASSLDHIWLTWSCNLPC